MAYVSPTSRSDGYVVPGSEWTQNVVTNVKYVAENGPRCRVARNATQSISSGSNTSVVWNVAADFDTDTMHEIVSHPSRITTTTAGLYWLEAYLEFAAGTAQRFFGVSKNGAQVWGVPIDCTNLGAFTCGHMLTGYVRASAADYWEVFVNQNTGGGLNINTTSYFAMHWIGV